jgi:DNA-binding LacI/PurR family transcriptional regulator
LWAQPERPDGLIVYPDMTARGVVLALLELQVKVPAELKLVLHRNQNVEFLCPLAADWVITREKDVAKALLQQIKDRFGGLKPRSYAIHQTFEKSASEMK